MPSTWRGQSHRRDGSDRSRACNNRRRADPCSHGEGLHPCLPWQAQAILLRDCLHGDRAVPHSCRPRRRRDLSTPKFNLKIAEKLADPELRRQLQWQPNPRRYSDRGQNWRRWHGDGFSPGVAISSQAVIKFVHHAMTLRCLFQRCSIELNYYCACLRFSKPSYE